MFTYNHGCVKSIFYRTRQCEKKPWSHEEEKSAVEKHLNVFITMMKAPGKKACAETVELESALQCRSWEAVKYYVYNCIQTKKK